MLQVEDDDGRVSEAYAQPVGEALLPVLLHRFRRFRHGDQAVVPGEAVGLDGGAARQAQLRDFGVLRLRFPGDLDVRDLSLPDVIQLLLEFADALLLCAQFRLVPLEKGLDDLLGCFVRGIAGQEDVLLDFDAIFRNVVAPGRGNQRRLLVRIQFFAGDVYGGLRAFLGFDVVAVDVPAVEYPVLLDEVLDVPPEVVVADQPRGTPDAGEDDQDDDRGTYVARMMNTLLMMKRNIAPPK